MVGQHKEVKVGCTCHCCYHKVNNYKITLVLSLLLQTKAYMNVTPYYQHIFPRNFINTLQIFFQKFIEDSSRQLNLMSKTEKSEEEEVAQL